MFDELSLTRFPSICPGCPYKAISLGIQKLKKRNLIDYVFGDIGCSTLLHFQKALDINLCMGASESMRQGFVRSKPECAHRVISLIGDSSECHSGMDATRNAVFRNTPGVKIILDNGAIAMTGGQVSPTRKNSLGKKRCNLDKVLEAEGVECVTVDAYNYKKILQTLENALNKAENGYFSSIIIDGECIQINESASKKDSQLVLDTQTCIKCGKCSVCPAIDYLPTYYPEINSLCTRCGSGNELCVQLCPAGALSIKENQYAIHNCKVISKDSINVGKLSDEIKSVFPDTLRVLICGVGGQGNLFMGKVLTNIVQFTPYIDMNILKGEVHGMAQKGGCVNSTFACGNVYSPIFASQSVDIMIAMEQNEALRPQYLHLLKSNATIVLNSFSITPGGVCSERFYSLEEILQKLCMFNVVECDANRLAPQNANIAILGILSTIFPFSGIPIEKWIRVLKKLSKNASVTDLNLESFELGRFEILKNTAKIKE
jgi:indolepyruvate ferredoxin oxidoreductase alpha subunit